MRLGLRWLIDNTTYCFDVLALGGFGRHFARWIVKLLSSDFGAGVDC